MNDTQLTTLASQVGEKLLASGQVLVTAESCTGGWIAKTVTDIAGSSRWFERGFVVYSNLAKEEMLGINAKILEQHGAVSIPIVIAMAEGALAASRADIAVAVSGIAGPGGGSKEKPVGTVCLAWATRESGCSTLTICFSGDREAVRRQTVVYALKKILENK